MYCGRMNEVLEDGGGGAGHWGLVTTEGFPRKDQQKTGYHVGHIVRRALIPDFWGSRLVKQKKIVNANLQKLSTTNTPSAHHHSIQWEV